MTQNEGTQSQKNKVWVSAFQLSMHMTSRKSFNFSDTQCFPTYKMKTIAPPLSSSLGYYEY